MEITLKIKLEVFPDGKQAQKLDRLIVKHINRREKVRRVELLADRTEAQRLVHLIVKYINRREKVRRVDVLEDRIQTQRLDQKLLIVTSTARPL
jgi:hypothetical protein